MGKARSELRVSNLDPETVRRAKIAAAINGETLRAMIARLITAEYSRLNIPEPAGKKKRKAKGGTDG